MATTMNTPATVNAITGLNFAHMTADAISSFTGWLSAEMRIEEICDKFATPLQEAENAVVSAHGALDSLTVDRNSHEWCVARDALTQAEGRLKATKGAKTEALKPARKASKEYASALVPKTLYKAYADAVNDGKIEELRTAIGEWLESLGIEGKKGRKKNFENGISDVLLFMNVKRRGYVVDAQKAVRFNADLAAFILHRGIEECGTWEVRENGTIVNRFA